MLPTRSVRYLQQGSRMKGKRLLQSDIPASEPKCGFSFISSRASFINTCETVAWFGCCE